MVEMSIVNYLKLQIKGKTYLNSVIHIQLGFSNTSLCVHISKLFGSLPSLPSMLFYLTTIYTALLMCQTLFKVLYQY